jgi:hypothetical protein
MHSGALAHTDQSSEAPADQATAQLSPFENNPARVGLPERVPPALHSSSFAFVVNGAVIESDVAEAVAFSPFVREQLSVDSCAQEFIVCERCIGSSAVASLLSILSGSAISVGRSEILLSGYFGNSPLECHLLSCWKAGIAATLSRSVIEKRVSFESADFAGLSLEALHDLLLSSAVLIESEDSLLRALLNLGSGYRFLINHIQLPFLSAEGISLLADHFEIPPESVWECAADLPVYLPHPHQLDSLILSDIPAIFAEFRGKQFKLLWRGSRDGFTASQFHSRCDGHPNTLIVILDTDGNIFGGFTPVEWDSGNGNFKADASVKSFLFTLKNPHNFGARTFALTAVQKHKAIMCDSRSGPRFWDIGVYDNCNANRNSFTGSFGAHYTNDTGLNGLTFLTGSNNFTAREIEVFEISG